MSGEEEDLPRVGDLSGVSRTSGMGMEEGHADEEDALGGRRTVVVLLTNCCLCSLRCAWSTCK